MVALSNAQVAGGLQKFNLRIATTTPVTGLATACVIATNMSVASAVTVNLPAGTNEQLMLVVDDKGDAGTNNVTIDGNGSETINNAATFVMNENRMGVLMQYSATGTNWIILGIYKQNILTRTSVDQGANRVQSKDLSANNVKFVDNTDTTKTIQFSASGASAGVDLTLTNACTADRVITFPDATATLVGTDTAQVITNKDIDGTTASNSNRITVPKNTTTNLNALDRKEATIVYDTDTNQFKGDDGSSLVAFATSAMATPTVAGIVTSYVPTAASGVSVITNANGTMTETDGFHTYAFSTGGSNRNMTLDAAADNAGRKITVTKIDNSVGKVIILGTINGATNYALYGFNESVDLICDGTGYYITSSCPSQYIQYTPTTTFLTGIATSVGYWKKNLDRMDLDMAINFNNATTSTTFALTLPMSATINTSKLAATIGIYNMGELATFFDDSTGIAYALRPIYNSTTAVRLQGLTSPGGVVRDSGEFTNTSIATIANNDYLMFRVTNIPIVTTS